MQITHIKALYAHYTEKDIMQTDLMRKKFN